MYTRNLLPENQYRGNLHLQLTLQGKYSHINIPNIKPETLRTLNILVPNNYTLFGSCYVNVLTPEWRIKQKR